MATPDVRPVGDLPDEIGKTAARELSVNGIRSLAQVARHTKKELLAIHGVGPKAIRILGDALAEKGLDFQQRGADDQARRAAPTASVNEEKKPRIFTMSFGSVYPLYVQKAEKKGRTKDEVDEIITWLTGYSGEQLRQVLDDKVDFETFFAEAPRMNPNVGLITGLVCGVRVEDVPDPLMQKIRYLDKLIDELARGKKMASILRS